MLLLSTILLLCLEKDNIFLQLVIGHTSRSHAAIVQPFLTGVHVCLSATVLLEPLLWKVRQTRLRPLDSESVLVLLRAESSYKARFAARVLPTA